MADRTVAAASDVEYNPYAFAVHEDPYDTYASFATLPPLQILPPTGVRARVEHRQPAAHRGGFPDRHRVTRLIAF